MHSHSRSTGATTTATDTRRLRLRHARRFDSESGIGKAPPLAMVEPVMSAFEEILDGWRRTKCRPAATGPATRRGDQVGQLVRISGFHRR